MKAGTFFYYSSTTSLPHVDIVLVNGSYIALLVVNDVDLCSLGITLLQMLLSWSWGFKVVRGKIAKPIERYFLCFAVSRLAIFSSVRVCNFLY